MPEIRTSSSWLECVELRQRTEDNPKRINRDLILENLKFQAKDFRLLSVGNAKFFFREII